MWSLIALIVLSPAVWGEFFRFQMPEEVPVNTVIAELPSLLNIPPMDGQTSGDYSFNIVNTNPAYRQMFTVDQRTGTLRTAGQIDRDSLCLRAELCCSMSGRHDMSSINDAKIIGMEAVQSKFANHLISTGLKCKLDLRIAFSSKSSKAALASIQIDLMDLNDNAPKFLSLPNTPLSRNYDGSLLCVVTIPENAETGYQLSLPLAQDGDAGSFGVQGYKLEEPSSQYGSQVDHRFSTGFPFELVLPRRDDGVILPKLELRENLDFEKRQHYYITLVAFDVDRHLPHSAEILIRVDVTDVNDNQPNVTARTRLQGSYDGFSMGSARNRISIREDTPVGTLLANFDARDADSGENGRITFAWAETTPPRVQRLFELNPTTGELRLADKLDYDSFAKSNSHESSEAYNLVIVASDEGRPKRLSTSASIVIELVDVNDEEPKITVMDLANRNPTQLEIQENEERDTFVALVTVHDQDGPNSPNGQFYCTLNTTLFRLTVADTVLGRKVHSSAMSSDHDDTTFSGIHNPIMGSGRAEFQLVTTTSFDREQTPIHYVAIRCRDKGSPPIESQATFAVTVLDVNDNPPHFPLNPLTVAIPEDAQVGSLVVALNATDPDRIEDSHSISYSLIGATALPTSQPMLPVNTSNFRLEGHTGRLLLTESLDREKSVEYQLTVRATDRGSPRSLSCDLALRIQVLDVNDNPPVFGSPSGYRFVLEEEKEAGTLVGVVSATDADEGKNGKISYRLFGTAAAVQRSFAVHPTTGEITTKITLDREVNAVYEFFVTAEDSSSSKRLTATAKVVVELLDINDNDPKFIYPTQPNHTIHASAHSKVGTAIVKLTVFDADAAGEQGLLFLMRNATSQGLFSLNPSTGELTFAREVLDNEIGSHYLEIEAKDNGVPSRSSVTSITVVIDTRNPPKGIAQGRVNLEYMNHPTYPKNWNQRIEDQAYSVYGQDTSADLLIRQDPPPSIDRRLILICCLAFLGFLLLVVFGAFLIRFRNRTSTDSTVDANNNGTLVAVKEAKYRAATLQPAANAPAKDINRYVYGWSSQRSAVMGPPRCVTATTVHQQQQHQRLLQDQQQEQFLRLGYVNGTNPVANFDNMMPIRACRDDSVLHTKNRADSLGDSLEEYERPSIAVNERSNLYLSQGQENHPGGVGVWEIRADRGLNNYEAPGDGNGYYNKLSGGAGVILQPGTYMQGRQFYNEECVQEGGSRDEPEDESFLASERTTAAARNAGYQTLSNFTTTSSSGAHQPTSSETDPFGGAVGGNNGASPSAFEIVRASGPSKTDTAWQKDLEKKGIIGSSFV